MKQLIYVIGEPGAGKTTLVRACTTQYTRHKVDKPIAHELLTRDGIIQGAELGYTKGMFSGTDTLAMNAITRAEYLLQEPPARFLIGEGARLANRRFLSNAVDLGYVVRLVYLTTPHAATQRQARGTGQDEAWARGAATRAANLYAAAEPPIHKVTLNGEDTDTPDTFRAMIDEAERLAWA